MASGAAVKLAAGGGGVSEDEAKALLRSSGPIKSQELVAKFKSRLKTQEVRKTSCTLVLGSCLFSYGGSIGKV